MSGAGRKSPPARTGGLGAAVGANAQSLYPENERGSNGGTLGVGNVHRTAIFRSAEGREWRFQGKRGRILRLLATQPQGVTQYRTYPWCTRLASHINVLRDAGLSIETVIEGPCRHARYHLRTRGELVDGESNHG